MLFCASKIFVPLWQQDDMISSRKTQDATQMA
jgi:hypothetical protein